MRLYYKQKNKNTTGPLTGCRFALLKTPRNKNALKIYMIHQHTCHVDRIEFNISVPFSSESSLRYHSSLVGPGCKA
jgi:ABC-type uncharacterized transport system ATPase subunit